MTNKERVGRAIELLQLTLHHTIYERLDPKADVWSLEGAPSGRTNRHQVAGDAIHDVSALLRILKTQWASIVGAPLTDAQTELVRRVREVRNCWAHEPQEQFTARATADYLETVARLLDALGATSEASTARREAEFATDTAVSLSDERLRSLLIDIAANERPFRHVVYRGRAYGYSAQELMTAAKACRESRLLEFEDPLTDETLLRLY